MNSYANPTWDCLHETDGSSMFFKFIIGVMTETYRTIFEYTGHVSSFKNPLQGVADCNKPTLAYLVDATSQSNSMRHLYWTWEWTIKRMHEATLLEEGLGISNFVGSIQGQDSLLISVLWNSLFKNWLWLIKYQAREAQPKLSTPIMLTNFLHRSHRGSQIPYLKHEQQPILLRL